MNLFKKLDRKLDKYLTDTDYKITIKKDNLNIINYKEIKDFSSTKIIISHKDGLTTITGDNLVVSKMQDNEALITGKIKNIEL